MLISYAIRDSEGNLIDGENYHMLLPPASNMKIPSTYYSYKVLGKDKILRTHFRIDGEVLQIYGDPLFIFSKSEFEKLLSRNIDKLKFVNYHNHMISDEKYHPDWMVGDMRYCYGAPIEPFTLDENCLGGSHKGEESMESLLENEFNLSRISSDSSENSSNNYNIITREIKLKDVISHILNISCNFSAELLMRYAAWHDNRQRDWIGAAGNVGNFLIKLGLDPLEFEVRDGSGLSRTNLFSTFELSNLMWKIYRGDLEFVSYFPEPGKGTLLNRLEEIVDYEVHAKTGTIRYISSLTGVSLRNGITFSMIAYGKETTEERQEVLDRLLKKILTRN